VPRRGRNDVFSLVQLRLLVRALESARFVITMTVADRSVAAVTEAQLRAMIRGAERQGEVE
jgi:hypothetical protein